MLKTNQNKSGWKTENMKKWKQLPVKKTTVEPKKAEMFIHENHCKKTADCGSKIIFKFYNKISTKFNLPKNFSNFKRYIEERFSVDGSHFDHIKFSCPLLYNKNEYVFSNEEEYSQLLELAKESPLMRITIEFTGTHPELNLMEKEFKQFYPNNPLKPRFRAACSLLEQIAKSKETEILVDSKIEENKSFDPIQQQIIELITSTLDQIKDNIFNKIVSLKIPDSSDANKGPNCKRCEKTISGVQFSCTECIDFYLCKTCEENEDHPHDLLKRRILKSLILRNNLKMIPKSFLKKRAGGLASSANKSKFNLRRQFQ